MSVATYRWLENVPPERETLGEEFRRVRKYLGLTQVQAAEVCDVSLQTITLWENNRRQFNSLEQQRLIRRSLNKLKRKRKWRDWRK